MERKMFFIDLDGTTLKDDKTVPEENLVAIQKVLQMGHYVAICTGRSLVSALPLADKLQMKGQGCYLIAYNGGEIYDIANQKMLRKLRMKDEDAKYLVQESLRAGIHVQYYGEQAFFSNQGGPDAELYAARTTMQFQLDPEMETREVFDTPKILLVSAAGQEPLLRFRAEHEAWARDKAVSFFSCTEYLEYCPIGSTKADGIRYCEDHLGIAHENTIAVGDEENDLSMIDAAAVGVVMINARDEIKEHADWITTKDNNHAGMAEAFYRFC